MSASASHLGLLDRVVSKAVILSDGLVVCDLKNRRRVAAFYMFYKIYCYPYHALEATLPRVHVPARLTRLAVSGHSRYLVVLRCRIVQFSGLFAPACVYLWNSLDEPRFVGGRLAAFTSQINHALIVD